MCVAIVNPESCEVRSVIRFLLTKTINQLKFIVMFTETVVMSGVEVRQGASDLKIRELTFMTKRRMDERSL